MAKCRHGKNRDAQGKRSLMASSQPTSDCSHISHNIVIGKAPSEHEEGAGHIQEEFMMHKNKVHLTQ